MQRPRRHGLVVLGALTFGARVASGAAVADAVEQSPSWSIADVLPDVLVRIRLGEVALWQLLALALCVGVGWLVGVICSALFLRIGRRLARRTATGWDDLLLEAAHRPVRWLAAVGAVAALTGLLQLPVATQASVETVLRTIALVVVTWMGLRLARFVAQVAEARLGRGEGDAARVRGIQTQVHVLRRVADVAVILLGSALVLVQFDIVRHLGASLLASAGIAGIVVGLAAQRSISTLLAGIQLLVTQPIRIGDTVIVENEWGWIEEITLTYVVVRVWDQRRLVVPITQFLEKSFQNWTKASPEILGSVFVHADYAVPVDLVRAELERIVRGHPLHDGRVCRLQVTEAGDRTVTLRALVSSADAGRNWDLRCDVRERLVAFLQQLDQGRYLPRARIDAAPPLLAAKEAAEQAA